MQPHRPLRSETIPRAGHLQNFYSRPDEGRRFWRCLYFLKRQTTLVQVAKPLFTSSNLSPVLSVSPKRQSCPSSTHPHPELSTVSQACGRSHLNPQISPIRAARSNDAFTVLPVTSLSVTSVWAEQKPNLAQAEEAGEMSATTELQVGQQRSFTQISPWVWHRVLSGKRNKRLSFPPPHVFIFLVLETVTQFILCIKQTKIRSSSPWQKLSYSITLTFCLSELRQ